MVLSQVRAVMSGQRAIVSLYLGKYGVLVRAAAEIPGKFSYILAHSLVFRFTFLWFSSVSDGPMAQDSCN